MYKNTEKESVTKLQSLSLRVFLTSFKKTAQPNELPFI